MVSGYNTGINTIVSTNGPKFDQIIRGNVKICKTGEQTYKITFLKATEFTLYQVWDENGDNSSRVIINDTDRKWQERLIAEQKRTGFAPTTIMEIGDCKWAFVITNAYFNKNKLVLDVSTKEIVNLSKTVKTKLPLGIHKNVRMDIDSVSHTLSCQECASIFNPQLENKILPNLGTCFTYLNNTNIIDCSSPNTN